MRLGIVNNPLLHASPLCRPASILLLVSALKPFDALLQFSPGHLNLRVWTVPMPELMTRSTPVPHQIKVVEFFAEMAISFGSVMAIERSFL